MVKELDATGTYDTDKHTGFDATDGTLYLYFKDATSIEAGKPYIVKWAKASDYDNEPSKYDIANPVFSGVTVTADAATGTTIDSDGHYVVTAKNSGLNTVDLIGTYSPAALTGGDKGTLYLGADNKLYYPSASMNINACRAYFHVDLTGQPNGVRAFVLNFGDEDTGVYTPLSNRRGAGGEALYTLDGRRLSPPTSHPSPLKKGIYINNGRKVVIK